MADHQGFCDPDWPPGTVKLAQLVHGQKDNAVVILQPRPTDDPNDPLNWPSWQKAINYALASFYAMMVYAFVNATSPTWGPMGDELGFDSATLTNTYAIGCATLAIGAPMLIPFALKFGSRPVYVLSSIGQFAISIWAARTMTAGDWWGVNATQCWLGALAEVMIQMTISDLFFVHHRGLANAIYVEFTNVGQNLAVVAAGFVTQNHSWRWVWWWFAIFFGLQIVMFVFGFEETKFAHRESLAARQGSVVQDSKSGLPEKITSVPDNADTEIGSADSSENTYEIRINPELKRKPYWKRLSLFSTSPGKWTHFIRHSWQPFMILATIPGVLFCALVYAIVLAWQTVMTATLSTLMLEDPWNFDAAQIGLMSLAPFIGSTLGSLLCGPLSDWLVLRLAKRNNGIYEPEMRFWVFLPFVPFQLAGAWWFGYALQNGWDWPQIAVALGVSYFGSAPLQTMSLTYMLDAYNEIIGDALTGVTFMRNLIATIFVFAVPAWTAAVGVANVFNTIGAIGLFILSWAAFFLWRGKQVRVKTARVYRYYADRQFDARPL
ncbi:hypothetical protein AMS68_004551 [Peltaster fructicola]|uniref:Major facilitator superfamily (MFS) profile domain-containing protein n=1 Tax=Peltaster fructicola TaxID=286661 RepID=A0A6H0XWD3_9PEZI|nr:hypothetical protein AMS68_004551 [Peltaster fructicola]